MRITNIDDVVTKIAAISIPSSFGTTRFAVHVARFVTVHGVLL